MNNFLRFSGSILTIITVFTLFTSRVLAAAETGEYLKYQEPQPTTSSWLATSGYVLSLFLTFLLVLGLAYLTSRFLAQKMTRGGGFGSGRVYASLSLGPNRAVYVVEIGGKFMVLGVTEQNISLLSEITSLDEIEQLKAEHMTTVPPEQFGAIFNRQLVSLEKMQKKFPLVFGSENPEKRLKEPENDSRKR
ncbi:flagellar biosynthetic protein FliO [Sporomusa aerivorans]|uniref:flagellar biosynthetic protein FliO n=1 Tax=Sporomusa aerivorans TaxID=204936 RepID=UPI00352A8F92